MKMVIISGGSIDDRFASEYVGEVQPDFVLAADKGMEFCKRCGIRPNLILGDFDSVSPEVLAYFDDIDVERYRPEKNAGDTELAVDRAIALGASEVHFLGALGRRMDHSLANIQCLVKLYEEGIDGRIVDPYNRISIVHAKKMEIYKKAQYGKYISFAPLRGAVTGVTLKSVHYPVTDRTMYPGDECLFLSNEIEGEKAEISYEDGILLMIESRDTVEK